MEEREVILSVKDLSVQFNLRGQVLTAVRGISLDGCVSGGQILYKGFDLATFKT